MTEDLVKRLREEVESECLDTMMLEAADRIEGLDTQLKDAHKRVEQLVLALYGVVLVADRDCPEFRTARAVLAGETK